MEIVILADYLIAYYVLRGISARNASTDTLFLQMGDVKLVLTTVMSVQIR